MNRMLFINLIWRNERVIIPELFDNYRIEYNAPPTELNIIGIGKLWTPSYKPPKTVYFENTQFWKDFIKKYIETDWNPKDYVNFLTELRDSREPCRLIVESAYENYDLNILALIDFASWNVAHGQDNDIFYSLIFYEYEPHEVKIIEPPVIINNEQVIEPQPPARSNERKPPPNATYEVVSGDSLWKISQKLCGDGSRWRELYTAGNNQSVIGSNPNRIYAGTKLDIPESWR